jgi:hypothetical protein
MCLLVSALTKQGLGQGGCLPLGLAAQLKEIWEQKQGLLITTLFASAFNVHMKGFNLVVHLMLAEAQIEAFLLLGEQTVWWGS